MIKKSIFLLFIPFTLLFIQCNREPLSTDPKVTNLSDYNSNDGAIQLSIKGGKVPYSVLWSNSETDTVIENLIAGSYYVTITDAKGKQFIDTIEVTQPAYPVCIDVDGNNYKTAIFGEQVWMIENLKVSKTSAGNEVSYEAVDSLSDKYGYLYTWAAALTDVTEESKQGICPDGWHIPSDEEWFELTDFTKQEGIELKNTFEPQFAGFYNNEFYNLGTSESYWSSTSAKDNAWKRYVHHNLSKVFRYHEKKDNAISVRCVRD